MKKISNCITTTLKAKGRQCLLEVKVDCPIMFCLLPYLLKSQHSNTTERPYLFCVCHEWKDYNSWK